MLGEIILFSKQSFDFFDQLIFNY